MILLDAGTSYAKILEQGNLRVVRTEDLPDGFRADAACGHSAARFSDSTLNELVALARGGMSLIGEKSFVLLDVGARDMKSVTVESGKLAGCNWNDSCGALCGFTLEIVSRQFCVDWRAVEPSDRGIRVTCGIFALSEMLDSIASGIPASEAAARLARGMAGMAEIFAGRPKRLFLSGGLCENPAYMNSFECEVVPLGRGVTIEGLKVSGFPEKKRGS